MPFVVFRSSGMSGWVFEEFRNEFIIWGILNEYFRLILYEILDSWEWTKPYKFTLNFIKHEDVLSLLIFLQQYQFKNSPNQPIQPKMYKQFTTNFISMKQYNINCNVQTLMLKCVYLDFSWNDEEKFQIILWI